MTGETFGQMLRRHRLTVGLSQNQLARQAGCDPAWVNRLERGGPSVPSRGVVLSLAEQLDLTPGQTDRFLFAAGLATCADWQTRAVRAETALASIKYALDDAEATDDDQAAEPISIRRAV